MKAIRLQPESTAFSRLKVGVKEASSVIQAQTPEVKGYSFYRGQLYSTSQDYVVGLRLYCTNEDGNYSVQCLEYDLQSRSLFYPPRMSQFEDEEQVKTAIEELIKSLEDMPYMVSQLYFDFVTDDTNTTNIISCYMVKDANEPGSVIAFATVGKGFHYRFSLSDGKSLCVGTALSVDWRTSVYELLGRVNKGEVKKEVAQRELKSLGIDWVD